MTVSCYRVEHSVTIRGNLTVHGNLIIVRRKDAMSGLKAMDVTPLAEYLGTQNPVYQGDVTLRHHLVIPAYAGHTFAVGGNIMALTEIIL